MIVIGESKRQVMERALAGGGYDWAMGVDLNRALDAEETAEEERRMAERYRTWATASLITYAPSQYESASRHYRAMPFETVNPIDDTVRLPDPYYDAKQGKTVASKNVFDKNVLSRRRFLFEIDGMALADQRKLLEPRRRNGALPP